MIPIHSPRGRAFQSALEILSSSSSPAITRPLTTIAWFAYSYPYFTTFYLVCTVRLFLHGPIPSPHNSYLLRLSLPFAIRVLARFFFLISLFSTFSAPYLHQKRIIWAKRLTKAPRNGRFCYLWGLSLRPFGWKPVTTFMPLLPTLSKRSEKIW